jgi:hypothetical protein
MQRPLNVKVRDTVYPASGDRLALVDRANPKYPSYRVRLFLEGPDLHLVRSATYHLHETFHPPVRRLERTAENPSCELEIWTWGVFTVLVDIEDITGRTHSVAHELTYGEQLKDARLADVSGSSAHR